MALDSATLLARTAAGEAELLRPSHGLALGQRRLLTQLQDPRAFDELVAEHALDAAKAERDLARLAQLGLVVLHLPVAANAPSFSAPAPHASATPANDPGPGRRNRLPLLVGAAVVLVALLAWLMLRSGATPVARADAAAAPAANAPAAAPAEPLRPAIAEPVPVAAPAVALGPANAPANRTDPRAIPAPELRGASLSTTREARPAGPVERSAMPTTASAPAATTVGASAAATAPAAMPVAAPVAAVVEPAQPAVLQVPPAPAPVAPPVQLASAAPTTTPAAGSARASLVPLSREAPEFPRDRQADGVTEGTVKARVVVDADGKVAQVVIVDAQPRRVFDRAVTQALSRWTFEPGTPGRTTEIDVNFRRE